MHHLLAQGNRGKNFAVRREKNARQTRSLPCVLFRRTAKSLFVVRFFFAVRPIKKRTAKKLFAVRPI
jgi:hypothetical protein